VRFTDILTTASAVANYRGSPEVLAEHILDAIEIVAGGKSVEDLGRPLSPLVRRPQGGSEPRLRDLVQRWYTSLGGEVTAEIDGEELDRFASDVRALSS
jgi:hypothetical protein